MNVQVGETATHGAPLGSSPATRTGHGSARAPGPYPLAWRASADAGANLPTAPATRSAGRSRRGHGRVTGKNHTPVVRGGGT